MIVTMTQFPTSEQNSELTASQYSPQL